MVSKACCSIALYCLFLLVLHDAIRPGPQVPHSRQLLFNRGLRRHLLRSVGWRRRMLGNTKEIATYHGPGLLGLPDAAFRSRAGDSSLSFMSFSRELPPPESLADCPSAGRFINSTQSAHRSPIAWAADGSAVVWGSSRDSSSVATVYLLDAAGSCNFSSATVLPLPELPRNYMFISDAPNSPPGVSALAMSGMGDAVLVAMTEPAVFVPPPPPPPGGRSIVEAQLPFHLVAFMYSRTGEAYRPSAILPIPAPPAYLGGKLKVAVSAVSLSQDGSTALVCLLQQGCSPNPSTCPGFAHVFQLLSRNSSEGDTWGLAATLPYRSYGTPVGHGVSCSLSPDGTVAAVLSGAVKVESVQIPVASDTSDSSNNSSSSTGSNNSTDSNSLGGGHRRQRLRRLYSDDNEIAAGNTPPQYTVLSIPSRQAYLSLYARDSQAQGGGGGLLAWAAVGSHPLDAAIADCIAGTSVPCRALVDVNERFASVAYIKGAELLTEVLYHTAAYAAESGKLSEFTKVCTLDKKLFVAAANTSSVYAPEPSASQLAMVALRQPAKSTGSLRVYVTTRDPASITMWTLSRRGDLACPPARNLLEDALDYASLSGLYTDVTADGKVLAVSGVPTNNLSWWLGVGA